jgi:hypothetical protein
MVEQTSHFYLFHLKDPQGHSRFYHSIYNPRDFTTLTTRTSVQGFYGSEPDFEGFRVFKQSIHKEIREEIRQQTLSRTFIPRFLFSSLVFLVIFLFLSLAVRDPIPLLDEILIALAGASIVWIVRSKKMKKNNLEAEQELLIRDVIEQGFFVPDEQLKAIEKMWQEVYFDVQHQELEDIESYIISLMTSNKTGEIITVDHTSYLEQILTNRIPSRAQKELLQSITSISRGKLLSNRHKRVVQEVLTKDKDLGTSVEIILYFVLLVHKC